MFFQKAEIVLDVAGKSVAASSLKPVSPPTADVAAVVALVRLEPNSGRQRVCQERGAGRVVLAGPKA